ncbi:Kynurenine/alpha-aminoadipate aminotransferase, mitochondrial [Aphelenchoides fujianensis]|nr:Kynurenine/alpha-aminoadipate aminotransferase, mitochondrial [Aphelenchoides fujianensis]
MPAPWVETMYDAAAERVRFPLHVSTPAKRWMHRFGRLMAAATAEMVESGRSFDYPLEVEEEGESTPEFLESLAAFLTREYGSEVKCENLVQTSGSTYGLQMLMSRFFPCDRSEVPVYVEQMTYFRTKANLQQLGFQLRPIPIEVDGLNVEELERVWSRDLTPALAANSTKEREFAAVLYVIPHFHNPLGMLTSEEKYTRIVELAHRFNVLVICDDVHTLLHHRGRPPSRLFTHEAAATREHVVSLGSFSKLFAPALRVGWIEAGPRIRRHLEQNPFLSDSPAPSSFFASALSLLLADGRAHEHLRLMRADLAFKMSHALRLLRAHLPPDCALPIVPTGGHLVFVRLPARLRSTEVAAELRKTCGIAVDDGQKAWTDGDENLRSDRRIANGLRVAVGFVEVADLDAALREFCRLLWDHKKPVDFVAGE